MKPICSICFESLKSSENIESTLCGHIYHPHCVREWVQMHRSCPDCRKVCFLENIHPIYINDESKEQENDFEGAVFSRALTLSEDIHCKDEIIKIQTVEIEKLKAVIRHLNDVREINKLVSKPVKQPKSENQINEAHIKIIDDLEKNVIKKCAEYRRLVNLEEKDGKAIPALLDIELPLMNLVDVEPPNNASNQKPAVKKNPPIAKKPEERQTVIFGNNQRKIDGDNNKNIPFSPPQATGNRFSWSHPLFKDNSINNPMDANVSPSPNNQNHGRRGGKQGNNAHLNHFYQRLDTAIRENGIQDQKPLVVSDSNHSCREEVGYARRGGRNRGRGNKNGLRLNNIRYMNLPPINIIGDNDDDRFVRYQENIFTNTDM